MFGDSEQMRRIGSVAGSPWLWIALGLWFWGLSQLRAEGIVAPRPYADVPLYALMILGLLINRGQGFRLRLPPRWAPVAFVGLSWGFGMLYEASLTVDGTGIGGVHPDTRASYLLAQGDYILIALATWGLVQHFHLTFRDIFFLAGGKSLTEGLVFTGVLTSVLVSPQAYAAPLMLAYYTLAYATFVALPLLIIDPACLWQATPPRRRLSIPALWLIGAVVAMVIRIIWGLGWAPFATWVFALPPNPL